MNEFIGVALFGGLQGNRCVMTESMGGKCAKLIHETKILIGNLMFVKLVLFPKCFITKVENIDNALTLTFELYDLVDCHLNLHHPKIRLALTLLVFIFKAALNTWLIL